MSSAASTRRVTALLGLTTLMTCGAKLSFYEESLPSTLNPLYSASMVDNRVNELIFDRLYFHSPITNDLQSRLVTQWELAEGGTGVKLSLRRDVKWQDGKNFTAKDVCFTVEAMLDPGTTSPIAEGYRSVFTGCEVVSKDEALVRFTKIFHNPLNRLGFYVLPEHMFNGNTAIPPDADFSSHPIGTGPAGGNLGSKAVAFNGVANAHHNPSIQEMTLLEGQDPLVQVKTLLNNGVQGIIAVPPPYRGEVSATDDLSLKSYDLRSWWFMAANQSKPYLQDKRVRQAIDLLLDRTDLRQLSIGVKPGEQKSPCEFISGPFVQASPYYNHSVPVNARSDRAKAEELLTAAGLEQVGGRWHYQGQPITLKIGIKGTLENEAPDLISQIGNQLGAAGFDRQTTKLTDDEWNTQAITGQLNSDYDLLIGKWSFGLVEDVNSLFHTRRDGRGAKNIFNYSNSQVDVLLAQYESAQTDTQAQDAYHKLHAMLADELPYIFLWKLDTKSAWRTDVSGTTIAPYYYWTEIDGWKYGG
jgi:peptide/nickel transport system substrate-binding protein